jgi:hypothetical protein
MPKITTYRGKTWVGIKIATNMKIETKKFGFKIRRLFSLV